MNGAGESRVRASFLSRKRDAQLGTNLVNRKSRQDIDGPTYQPFSVYFRLLFAAIGGPLSICWGWPRQSMPFHRILGRHSCPTQVALQLCKRI